MRGAEAVHVLELDLRAELLLPGGTQRNIHVAAHLSLFHIAVADAAVLHDLLDSGEIGVRFVGAAHVGLADNLEQRHARNGCNQRRTRCHMVQFGRVLLKMDAGDADDLFRQRLAGEAGSSDPEFAALAERQVELADLVVLDEVRVEVALAVELAELCDFAPGQESGPHRLQDRLAVRNRQRAGIPEADRTGQRIRLRSVPVCTGTEHFAFGTDLDVYFNADNCFVFHGLFSLKG